MSNLLRIALIVLIIGIACIVIVPLIFTQSGFSLDETGELGDTIGGITAPISSLVGSVLVFLALKGQVLTNKITQEQIRDQRLEEQRKKETMYVSDLYRYFLNSIKSYETRYHRGYKAIRKVMNMLAVTEQKQAHDENRLYYGTAAELFNILKIGKLFLEQINKSRLDDHDKRYFKELVKHHYDSFILPYIAKDNENPDCAVCGESHNGVPLKMLALIKETVLLF